MYRKCNTVTTATKGLVLVPQFNAKMRWALFSPLYVHDFKYKTQFLEHQAIRLEKRCKESTIGDKLRYFRVINGFCQKEVAEFLGIAPRTYKAYENPRKKNYEVEVLQKLANLYQVPDEEIFDDYHLFFKNGQGDQIYKKRQAMNLSQLEFGRLLGVGRKTIGKWERGEARVSSEVWERVCKIKD
ncbi:MAG: helix-turn-helix transcriptional regulator [Clostridia bacterium]